MSLTKAFSIGTRSPKNRSITEFLDDDEAKFDTPTKDVSKSESKSSFGSGIIPAPNLRSGTRSRTFEEEEKCTKLLDENLELHERLEELEKELKEKTREKQQQRLKIQELEEARMRSEVEEVRRRASSDQETSNLQKTAQRVAMEELRRRRSQQDEENMRLRTQLTEAEQRQTTAKAEQDKLAAQLAKQRENEQRAAQQLEDMRAALADTQSTLDREREILKLAREENRELLTEVNGSVERSETSKVVLGHKASLEATIDGKAVRFACGVDESAEPAKRTRKGRFVTMDLLSQLADVSDEEASVRHESEMVSEMDETSSPDRAGGKEAGNGDEGGGPGLSDADEGGGRALAEQLAQAKDREEELRRRIQELEEKAQAASAGRPPFWNFLSSSMCCSRTRGAPARPPPPPPEVVCLKS